MASFWTTLGLHAARTRRRGSTLAYRAASWLPHDRLRRAAKARLALVPSPGEVDSLYGWVEPDIRDEWGEGALDHLNGQLPSAIRRWSSAMHRQAALARDLPAERGTRFFEPIWTCAIGHIALLAMFAKARRLGLFEADRMVIVTGGLVANRAYLDYFRGEFEILDDPSSITTTDRRFATELPGVVRIGRRWRYLNRAIGIVEQRWVEEGRAPLLTLSPEHRRRGEAVLASWGMPPGAWFVVLHVREEGRISGGFETDSVRNASIEDYADAIRLVTARGGWVVRMGGPEYRPLPPMPNVVDYAARQRHEDWIDVYLLGAARLMIGTNSGPVWVANSFGVEVLFTNWAPVGVDPFWREAGVLRKSMVPLAQDPPAFRWPAFRPRGVGAHIESIRTLRELGLDVRDSTPGAIAGLVEAWLARERPTPR